MQTVFGIKQRQSQVFLEDGTRVPVTVVSMIDTTVTQQKTLEKDGYAAVQVGIGSSKKISKALLGQFKKANISISPKYIREVRIDEAEDISALQVGSKLDFSTVLTPGDSLKVTGTSKGKGFAGGVKRHGFGGGPKTHGQSDRHRAPGAIGQGTTPGRVYKGKRMAGRMGSDTVSVTNLYVVDIQGNEVYVSGLIPGSKNALVRLEKTGEKKNFVPVFRVKEESHEEAKETEKADETTQTSEENVEAKTEHGEGVTEEKTEEVQTDAANNKEESKETKSSDEEPIAADAETSSKEEVKEDENANK